MARTPLLRALRQLAGEHAAAEERGIPVEEVRARREEQAYSRRDFLKRTGAVGAALAAAGPAGALVRTARGATAPRIAIVGGGIAGLTTALTLQDHGIGSTVYEAHPSRIGGRMHSDFVDFPGYWTNGQGAELCGELIDTGHKTILGLARRFNLATVDLLGAEPNGSTDTYRFFGDYYPADEADRDFKAIRAALHRDLSVASYPTTYKISTAEGIVLDNMSIYEWIESRVPGGHSSPFGQLLDVAYNIEYGAETTEQSALNLVYLLGYSGAALALYGQSDERFHIVGGNTLLPLAIRDSIAQAQGASAVRMGWRLSSVKANADGTVALGFDSPDGKQTVTADHAILCMSFSVLRTLDTAKSGFDLLKKTAVTKLGSGANSKLQLQFASRLWNTAGPWGLSNGSTYADTGYQNTWDVTRGQPGATGILVDYTGGDVAAALRASVPYATAANAQVATYARRFLDQLEPVFPGINARWNGKATLSNPTLDPNLLCSYSYWKPGQYHTFSGYEGVRQGNIHFAGEHCSQDFQGYMEGGASEGVRAANEILADIKRA